MATAAGATAVVTSEKVGFWIRVVAFVIDGIILGILSSILSSILFGGDQIRANGLNTLLGLAYSMYFWSSYGHGQTVGDRIMKIRVIKTDGSELSLTEAFIRYVGLVLSFLVVFIGVIWVAFDANKQGWHDKIANTYVVKA
ncbi:MAG TPA: RDD family protein [Candidatus Limnocylindria bacterium]|nr:RDD family protein [Candidatus Limnocylindria bacterium]